MKIEYWSYAGVKPDGTFANDPQHEAGAVGTKPRAEKGQSRGFPWISVTTGRLPDSTMHGITLYFDSKDKMLEFEQKRVIGSLPQFEQKRVIGSLPQ
jgi:hypothetical protein